MKNKSILAIIIFVLVLLVSTIASAVPDSFYFHGDGQGEFSTVKIGDTWILCIQKGGPLKETTYEGEDAGRTSQEYCVYENGHVGPEWEGDKYQSKLTLKNKIDNVKHQDALYALINSTDIEVAQKILWALDINKGSIVSTNEDLYKESVSYRAFYEKIQAAGGFKPTNSTNTSKVKVAVNKEDDTYTVGPFKISYLDDYYKRSNGTRINFGEITGLNVISDTGAAMQLVDIQDARGNSIRSREYKYPTNGEEFFVKFKGNAKSITLDVNFKYLRECTGSMYEYQGEISAWSWIRNSTGQCSHVTRTTRCHHVDPISGVHSGCHDIDIWENFETYQYKLKKSILSSAQTLLGYAFDGAMQWDTARLSTSPRINITMNISGKVFLDKDEGKVNEGNNVLDNGEGLEGIEVTLYEIDGTKVNLQQNVVHKHTGNSGTNGGCYTTPVYHTHIGNESVYGACYSEITHVHKGSSAITGTNKGGAGTCFTQPIYHTHDVNCYDKNDRVICGKTTSTLEFYKNTCGITPKYKLTCNKQEGKTIDYYAPSCGMSETTVTGTKQLLNPVLTNKDGYYEFTGLDAQKDYYVKFTYNGILYTNVLYNKNGDITSKATEDYQEGSKKYTQEYINNRTNFNNKFAEIGSYPSNYKTKHWKTGAEIYNTVYLQENIADLFKEVAQAMVTSKGNSIDAYQAIINKYKSTDPEIEQKVQFIADCRINAYTVETYSMPNQFVIDSMAQIVAGKGYAPIYSGTYNQTNVNLGMKNRPTVDLALYKDSFKAEVVINGKSEIYEYDARKGGSDGFSIGVSESDYLNGIRNKYLAVTSEQKNAANKEVAEKITKNQTRELQTDKYEIEMRTEEIANGQSGNYKQEVTGQVNPNYQLNYNYENLTQSETGVNNDRLKIFLTYKIAIRNQSGIIGAVTEVVDYYDPNYEFVNAYVGDTDGNKLGTVTKYDESMYAANGNNMYKSTKGTYKTMYLRPDEETRLHNDNKEQYIFVTLQLLGPANDAGTILSDKLLNNDRLLTINLAEINGYKTYDALTGTSTPGLIDIDSNPGNLNITNVDEFTEDNIKNYPNIVDMYEDDTSRAPTFIFKIKESRTLEGTVFEDATTDNSNKIDTAKIRQGNGKLDEGETGIKDVIVELVEIKNNQMIVRSTTRTNEKGWYGFTGFLPGDYTVRFTYGSDNDTAMNKQTAFEAAGQNDKSYNGQDFQSTIFGAKEGNVLTNATYNTDETLGARYNEKNAAKNNEEANVNVSAGTLIDKYDTQGFYWYTINDQLSDARDDVYRKNQVIDYSKSEYGREITNHKSEVLNSYQNAEYYADYYPEMTKELHNELVSELERRTYRYAYTAQIPVEVEYAKTTVVGNYKDGQKYEHKITGVDFGIVERPKSELVIDQDVAHIKVTAADGITVLFDTDKGVNNLQWIKGQDANKGMINGTRIKDYDKNELINVIMDSELISGAKIEITYNFTVTNNGETDGDTTSRAKKIINYVANNLNFEVEDNKDQNGNALWQVVKLEDIQNSAKSTLVNNRAKDKRNQLDLSTQTTTLLSTDTNPLASTSLKPGESVSATLKLTKILSAESSEDDLSYTNMAEIVEIDNTVGRYDHAAIPGNQDLEEHPQEHDTAGASKLASRNNKQTPPDGEVIVTPPTGSKRMYYGVGAIITLVLLGGIYLIKRKVVDKK